MKAIIVEHVPGKEKEMKLFGKEISKDMLIEMLEKEEEEKKKRYKYNKEYNRKKRERKKEVYRLSKEMGLIK